MSDAILWHRASLLMWMFVFLCGARPRLGVTFASFGLVRFAFLIVLKRWRLWVLVFVSLFF
ncbi:hypothetical protein, partial [Gordonia rubripertincta]|uniref:hypothetical protein n=1 Tax=Gordonia rubripertincta TaxID=36822 RepID=UPI001B34E2E2